MKTLKHGLMVFGGLMALTAPLQAQESVDKGQYNFFNPTPKEFMKDLDTDRPDRTESPRSVDAGHFQVEADIVSYFQEGADSESLFGNLNLKVGLTNNMDLQLIVPAYTLSNTIDKDGKAVSSGGLGDIAVRWKINLFGNDDGPVAMGLMPWAQFPTGAGNNGAIEGGLIMPFAVDLPLDFGLGFMFEADLKKNEADANYHTELVSSITFGRDIIGDLSAYVELWSLASSEAGSEWQATFDIGVNYLLTPDLKFDAGINIGLTPATDDFNPFLGVTYRY